MVVVVGEMEEEVEAETPMKKREYQMCPDQQRPSGSTTKVRRAHGVRWFSQSLWICHMPYAICDSASEEENLFREKRVKRVKRASSPVKLKAP